MWDRRQWKHGSHLLSLTFTVYVVTFKLKYCKINRRALLVEGGQQNGAKRVYKTDTRPASTLLTTPLEPGASIGTDAQLVVLLSLLQRQKKK